jgi:hypothetical protein
MSFEAVLNAHGVTAEQWERGLMKEYLRRSHWMKFSGKNDNAIIMTKDRLTGTPGDAINIPIRSQLIGGVVTGNEKVEGQEGRIEFYNQNIQVDNDNVAVRMDNVPMVEQRVAFSALQALRSAIVDARELRTDDRITTALSDTSLGRVRGRYLYGAADSNWDATHATALQNIDNSDDQLTTRGVGICRRKAEIPVNATAKIRPMRINLGAQNGVQTWYTMHLHTYCGRDLTQNDAAWRQPMLLIPSMMNSQNPIFTGSTFLGGFEGVLYYKWDGILLGSSNIQYAHNLFCGAQAAAMVWAQFGRFKDWAWNYGEDVGLKHHEINEVKKLVFDRNAVDSTISNEDHGTIHYFTAAVAD